MRDMTPGMVGEVTARNLKPILLMKAEFDEGTLTFWTGYGTLEFNGEDYIGSGNLINVSEVSETENLQANGVVITLSGVPDTLTAIAQTANYSDRPITIWFGALDEDNLLVPDPFILFSGLMDVMTMKIGGNELTISVKAESRLISLKRARERRYTPEDQKLDYPDDRFFDKVAALQDTEVVWGNN